MKVSGFTFVRNVVKYDYPVVESIRSVLPVVDEFIVNVGRCDDGTLELIRSIGDPKIRIVESVWDETLRKDGLIYAQQTNIALSHCAGDWAFYIKLTRWCTRRICLSFGRPCDAILAIQK